MKIAGIFILFFIFLNEIRFLNSGAIKEEESLI